MKLSYHMKIITLGLALFMTGCAVKNPYISKKEAFPEMYNETPLSILIMPAINNSTAAEASDYLSTTIAEPLSMSGFYVAPVEATNAIFQQEGIVDGAQLAVLDPAFVGRKFGVDAVMFLTIQTWDTSYYVVGGNVTVGISYNLFSSESGAELWKYNETLTINTGSDQGGIAGLIITAIKTATTDYVPIAKKVNYMSLTSVPFGKYHSIHGLDGEFKAVNKNKNN